MAKRGMLFTISGPAAAGKGTIVRKLTEEHEFIRVSVSCTTRAPRPGEIDGVHYHFVTEEEFSDMVEKDMFYEWAHVHLNRYGTPKDKVAEMLDAGYDVILEIDVQGSMQVLQKNPDVVGIFIMPPSAEKLEERLINRQTETAEACRVRMKNAVKEMEMAKQYPYVVVNEDWNEHPGALEEACRQVLNIMQASRNRTRNNVELIDSVIDRLSSRYL
ncbi:MAG: guanylate kinase [Clostridia bacterium]|nr:guanylate kinase [Clostridia bacterium]